MNEVREKILLLLLGGIALGFCYTPGQQWRVVNAVSREWNKISKKELREGVSYLYRLKYIDKEQNKNNLTSVVLTKKGKLTALNYQLENIKNKGEKWDGKWRMVAFDIPEKYRKGRDALRYKLKNIGFCELQKSVLITPYNCDKEIGSLVEYFELGRYVRFGILERVDNQKYFEKIFKLS